MMSLVENEILAYFTSEAWWFRVAPAYRCDNLSTYEKNNGGVSLLFEKRNYGFSIGRAKKKSAESLLQTLAPSGLVDIYHCSEEV